jgi:hypothetical protein
MGQIGPIRTAGRRTFTAFTRANMAALAGGEVGHGPRRSSLPPPLAAQGMGHPADDRLESRSHNTHSFANDG